MGRYKSILNARIAAKRFEHAVDIDIPSTGLGKTLDTMSDWCKSRCKGDDWAKHSSRSSDFKDYARFYFTYPNIADAFAEEFGGLRVDKVASVWPKR